MIHKKLIIVIALLIIGLVFLFSLLFNFSNKKTTSNEETNNKNSTLGSKTNVSNKVIKETSNSESSENYNEDEDDDKGDSSEGVSNDNPTVESSSSPSSSSETNKCTVYSYKDKYFGEDMLCINKIFVKGIYFVPKDQVTGIKSYWSENMSDVLNNVKDFFEEQFENKIDIEFGTFEIVYGDKNINDYTGWEIQDEIYDEVSSTLPSSNEYYVDIQTFIVSGEGGVDAGSIYNGAIFRNGTAGSINPAFWLDPDMLEKYTGYIMLAHEFGHSLGMVHPWDEEVNKDSSGNIIDRSYGNLVEGSIMSYGGLFKKPLIPNFFIRNEVKERMIK